MKASPGLVRGGVFSSCLGLLLPQAISRFLLSECLIKRAACNCHAVDVAGGNLWQIMRVAIAILGWCTTSLLQMQNTEMSLQVAQLLMKAEHPYTGNRQWRGVLGDLLK